MRLIPNITLELTLCNSIQPSVLFPGLALFIQIGIK